MTIKNPLVIVSFDAMGAEDIAEHIDLMPNVATLIARGTHVKKLKAFIQR